MGSPWLRLAANMHADERLFQAGARTIWPWVLCRLKDCDGEAPDHALSPARCARDHEYLTEEQCATMLDGLRRVGLLVRAGEVWTTPKWRSYQPDPTAADRMRKSRERRQVQPAVTVTTVSYDDRSPPPSDLRMLVEEGGAGGVTPVTVTSTDVTVTAGKGRLMPHVAPDATTDADPPELRLRSVLTLWCTLFGREANQGVAMSAERWVHDWPIARVRWGLRRAAEIIGQEQGSPFQARPAAAAKLAEGIMRRATDDEVAGRVVPLPQHRASGSMVPPAPGVPVLLCPPAPFDAWEAEQAAKRQKATS